MKARFGLLRSTTDRHCLSNSEFSCAAVLVDGIAARLLFSLKGIRILNIAPSTKETDASHDTLALVRLLQTPRR